MASNLIYIEALHEFIDCLQTKVFEPVYTTVKMASCSPVLLSTYSDNNDFIMSDTNDSVGAVIMNAFEQSAILTVSYVICKASIELKCLSFVILHCLMYECASC